MPPKHPDKDIRALLDQADDQGWEVIPPTGRGYWKIRCVCPDKHWSTVKISPSNPNYLKELRRKLQRETCWKEV